MSRFPHDYNFRQDYDDALNQFTELRALYTRRAACGRLFVLVPSVTKDLEGRSPGCNLRYSSDLERLRIASYHRLNEPVGISPTDLKSYLSVLYTLLDIGFPHLVHLFRQQRLDDRRLPLSIEELRSKISNHKLPSRFHENFYEKQYAWCPIVFGLNMGEQYYGRIVPVYRKRRIQPRKDSHRTTNSATCLWEVELPEELVDQGLRDEVPNAELGERDSNDEDLVTDKNTGKRWRFALKRFSRQRYRNFESERDAFRLLGKQHGMIKYIGWFQHEEIDLDVDDATTSEFWTIVLEFAEFDLCTLFRETNPPMLPSEIDGFWHGMLDISRALKSIHHDLYQDRIRFDLWHGDIKPENILRVGEQLKLADPGEATYRRSGEDRGAPVAPVPGGTTTYAAPEKSNRDGSGTPSVSKLIDVWSLGCVFSEAATFVVTGSQGVLQFERVRHIAIRDHCNATGDAFHDKRNVLAEVREWHEFLRCAVRNTDMFTVAVLDLVDKHMLVPHSQRWNAKEVCNKLQDILETSDTPARLVPQSIETMLEEIDVYEERRNELNLGIKRVGSNDGGIEAHTPRTPSSNKRIFPTVQRSRHRETQFTQALRDAVPNSSTGSTGRTVRGVETQFHNAPELVLPQNPGPVMTIWAIEGKLKKMGKKGDLSSLTSRARKSMNRLMRSGPAKDTKLWQDKDDPLHNFLDGVDIIYLIDNGSSMFYHWEQVSHWVKVLVWRSLGYDDDGMEMCFTGDNTACVKQSTSQKIEDFTTAIDLAKPPAPNEAGAVRTNIQPMLDNIINDYIHSISAGSKGTPKKKLIVVLTDGVWDGMKGIDVVDKVIKPKLDFLMDLPHFTEKAKSRVPFGSPKDVVRAEVIKVLEEERPVTIQFIGFGHDPAGLARLRSLDEDLERMGFPDLIDTEPADGDVYKMFLGSLKSEIDKQTTYAETIPSTPRTPPTSFEDASSPRSRSDTTTSDLTLPSSPLPGQSMQYGLPGVGSQFDFGPQEPSSAPWPQGGHYRSISSTLSSRDSAYPADAGSEWDEPGLPYRTPNMAGPTVPPIRGASSSSSPPQDNLGHRGNLPYPGDRRRS
ncbi:Protein kinase domain-containing protein [Pleurostoma richardsiae]|uniref:Protein kinase domain-containing protein n=1 Tax=Pleurostoma richardsiae TaxID=41990 RepID=A0AA38S5N8_9PEZI|nr:Protein kinase domain-containing protein [Pleurostoma richardsiae]